MTDFIHGALPFTGDLWFSDFFSVLVPHWIWFVCLVFVCLSYKGYDVIILPWYYIA
jgi:hypothetical protein